MYYYLQVWLISCPHVDGLLSLRSLRSKSTARGVGAGAREGPALVGDSGAVGCDMEAVCMWSMPLRAIRSAARRAVKHLDGLFGQCLEGHESGIYTILSALSLHSWLDHKYRCHGYRRQDGNWANIGV